MKNIIALAVLTATLALVAVAADKPSYQVRCPACAVNQTLTTTKVLVNGGYSTNVNGVVGNMQQATGAFKCPICKAKFNVPLKPDKFVPMTVAIEVPAKK